MVINYKGRKNAYLSLKALKLLNSSKTLRIYTEKTFKSGKKKLEKARKSSKFCKTSRN